jgi:hypothetical protein
LEARRLLSAGDRGNRTGRITKAGPDTLRWAAVEAAQQAWWPTTPWHPLYTDTKTRHGKSKPPRAAVARKILIGAWYVLARRQPFKACAPHDAARTGPGKLPIRLARRGPKKRSEKPGECNATTCAAKRRKRPQHPNCTSRSPTFKETSGSCSRRYLSVESMSLLPAAERDEDSSLDQPQPQEQAVALKSRRPPPRRRARRAPPQPTDQLGFSERRDPTQRG